MKKIFTLLLAVLMIASMSVTAFAAETTVEEEKTETITVTGIYDAGSSSPAEVISVDISWGSMAFTYTEGEQVWNPATHTYEDTAGTWSYEEGANVITVTNHSNVDISIHYYWSDNPNDLDTILGTFYYNGSKSTWQDLPSADSEEWRGKTDAPSVTQTFEITSGTISANSENLGTIELTITKTTH